MFERIKSLVLSILKVPPEPAIIEHHSGTINVFRAAPNYYRYRFYLWLIKAVIGNGVYLAVIVGVSIPVYAGLNAAFGSLGGGIVLAAILCLLLVVKLVQMLFSYTVLRLDYEMRWYIVTDRSLRIREGVISVKEMTMSFANIQNISIAQGPLQRLLGIADLKVETAGGGGMIAGNNGDTAGGMHIAYFRGVDNAEEIKSMMKEQLKLHKDAGLGDHDDMRHEHFVKDETGNISATSNGLLTEIAAESKLFRKEVEMYVDRCCS